MSLGDRIKAMSSYHPEREEERKERKAKVVISKDLIAEIVQMILGDKFSGISRKARVTEINLVKDKFSTEFEAIVMGPEIPGVSFEAEPPVIYTIPSRGEETPTDDFKRSRKIRKKIEMFYDEADRYTEGYEKTKSEEDKKREEKVKFVKDKKKKGKRKIKPKKKNREKVEGKVYGVISKSVMSVYKNRDGTQAKISGTSVVDDIIMTKGKMNINGDYNDSVDDDIPF